MVESRCEALGSEGSEDSASANADITQHIVRVYNEKDKMHLGIGMRQIVCVCACIKRSSQFQHQDSIATPISLMHWLMRRFLEGTIFPELQRTGAAS